MSVSNTVEEVIEQTKIDKIQFISEECKKAKYYQKRRNTAAEEVQKELDIVYQRL